MKLQLVVNRALLPEQLLTGERAQRFCARTKGTVINQLLDCWVFSVLISFKHRRNTAGLVLLLTAHWRKTLMPEAYLSLAVAVQFCRYEADWEQSQSEYARLIVWYIRLRSSAVNSLQRYQSRLHTAHEAWVNQPHAGDISGGFRGAEYTPRLRHNCLAAVQVVQ